MFVIAALCVIIALLYYYFYEMKISRIKRITSNMPSPKNYPLVGSALNFGSTPEEIMQGFDMMTSVGPVVPVWIGNTLYVFLSGVNEIQTILSNSKLLSKSHTYDYLYPWLGPGLLLSDGDEWRRQRKIITPAFHFKMLEQFVDIFSSNVHILINRFDNEVGNKGFDVNKLLVLCTLDIVSETSMGIKLNAQIEHKENSFIKAISDVSLIFIQRSVKPWLYPEFIFNMFPEGKLFNRQVDLIHKFVQGVIDNRRKLKAELMNKNVSDEDSEIFGKKKKTVFLDLLIDSNMTDKEILSQVNTFMFAGHDTTTHAISFALYCLMKYPEIQENVYKEQMEVIGEKDKSATYQDLKDLKYLECVINESMRLYPSVPVIGRKITEDLQITSEYILPKGCSVSLCFHKLHRDPSIYPNPDKFDPDRFLPDEVKNRHPYAFLPFSAGSRNCIGQKFAMMEMKAIVGEIVRKFKILPPIDCPELVVGMQVTLEPVNGVYIRLERR